MKVYFNNHLKLVLEDSIILITKISQDNFIRTEYIGSYDDLIDMAEIVSKQDLIKEFSTIQIKHHLTSMSVIV